MLGSISRDSTFNVAFRGVGKGLQKSIWLAKTWTKSWFSVSDLEMSDLPWFNEEEWI